MTDNAKQLYNELSKRGRFFDTEEAFEKELQTEEGAKFYYDVASKEGLWMDTFEGFKSDIFGDEKPKEQEQEKTGFLQRTLDRIQQAQPYVHKGEEDKKAAESARQEQAYQTVGMTDEDKKKQEQVASLEAQATSPISVNDDGTFEVNIPMPTFNQYGMPTNVTRPVNPVAEKQLAAAKANLPSYLKRGENSPDDIMLNAAERALNTEEGKNIWNTLLDAAVKDFHATPEFAELLNKYSLGEVTEQDINNAFNEKYGEQLQRDFTKEISKEGGIMHDYITVADKKFNQKHTDQTSKELDERIESAIEKSKETRKNSNREKYKSIYGVYPEDDPFGKERTKQLRYEGVLEYETELSSEQELLSARKFNKETRTLIDAVKNGKSFWGGVGDAASDLDTWDLGIGELTRNIELMGVIKKIEGDKELTHAEELLMESALNYFTASAYYSNELGRGYKAGQTSMASVPFMLQFVLSSGTIAAMEASVKGAVETGRRALVSGMIKYAKKKGNAAIAKYGAKKVAGDVGKMASGVISGAASSVIGAGYMTGVYGLPRVAGGTIERMTGELDRDWNSEKDGYVFAGRKEAQGLGEALWNSFADNYIENLSEMVLAKTLDPVKAYLGGTNMFKNIARNDYIGAIVDLRNNPALRNLRQTTQFGGYFEEVAEEYLGGILRRMLNTDVNTWQEAGLDLDGQIDIFLGLAPTSLLFGTYGVVSHYGGIAIKAKELREYLSTDEQKEMFDRLMSESRSGEFGDVAHNFIRNVLTSTDPRMTVERKKEILMSVANKYHNLLSEELQNVTTQVTEQEAKPIVDELTKDVMHEGNNAIYATVDSQGNPLFIVGGNVRFTNDNVVDLSSSDNRLQVRYVKEDHTLDDVQEVRTANLTNPVTNENVENFSKFQMAKFISQSKSLDNFEFDGHVYSIEGEDLGTVEEFNTLQGNTEQTGEPKIDTKPRTVVNEEYTVTVDGEKKTVKITSMVNSPMIQNEDGSIKEGKFSVTVNGEVVRGDERKQKYIDAISEQLKEKHAKALEAYRAKQAENTVTETPSSVLTDEDRAAAAAEQERMAKETEKQTILASAQQKKAKKYTPEETVVVLMEQGNDVATRLVGSRIDKLHAQIDEINADETKDELEKWEDSKELSDQLTAYEQAITKWLGQETLDAINAARAQALQNTPPVQGEAPAVPAEQAPVVEPAQDETPADAPAGPDTTPLPLPDVTPMLEGTEGEQEGDGETPAPNTLGEEGGVEGNEEGEEPAPAADKPTANLDEVTVWVAKNYDYIVTDKEGNTIFSSKPTRKKVTDAFEELHQVEGKVDGKRGTYNGEDCIIVRDNPAKGYVNIVTPHGIERVGREEVMIDGKPLKGKASVVEWRESNEKKYDTFESIMNFPVFDIRGEMNITFLDFLNTQQDSPYVAFYEMLRKHYREKYNDDVAQQYLDASVARLIENLKEVARLWNIVRTKRLISSGQMPTTLERKKMDSQSKRMKEAVAAVHNAVGLDNSIDFSGLAELSEKAAKKAEKKGEGEGYFAETDKEKAESYVDGLVSNILWVGFETKNRHEHKDAVEGIVEALNKESKKASKQRELVVNILNDRLEEAKRFNRLNDIQAIERVIDRLSTLKKMKPLLTEAGLIEEKGKKNAPAKPAPKKDTSALKKQLSIEENSLRDLEEDYKRETDEAEKSELEGYIAQAKEKIAKLKAEIDGAEFMVGNRERKNVSVEARELAFAAVTRALDNAGIKWQAVSLEEALRVARENGKAELLQTTNSTVYGYVLDGVIYLAPDGMNAETAVHEYTHLWVRAMRKYNPNAWRSILSLLRKNEDLFNKVKVEMGYDPARHNENDVASEMIARYTEDAGLLYREAQEVVGFNNSMESAIKINSIVNRIRMALNDFWNWVGKTLFDIPSFNSMDEVANQVLYDLFNETNLVNPNKSSTFAANKNIVPASELAVAYEDLFARQQRGQFSNGYGYSYSANFFHISIDGKIVKSIQIEGNENEIKLIKERYETNESTGTFIGRSSNGRGSSGTNNTNDDSSKGRRRWNDGVDGLHEERESNGSRYNQEVSRDSNERAAEREQIVAEAKANGTYMMHNGQPTNLTEDQWVTVRTQDFKDYFGDWINDKDNASVVLDENGEPLVVYHGSRMAGFDKFGRGEARDSQGIYTTPNRRAAESYATSAEEWRSGQTMPEAELGVPDHHGVYSLFVNMRNPKVIDFEGKEFDRFGTPKYEVATNEALDNGERGILFDTLEEAEAYIAEHPEEDLDYVEKYTTSDDMLLQAKEEGYDGVIFTNIIDSRYPDPITNYVPFEPNQVKSATQNVGTFNPENDRIEFMLGPAAPAGAPRDPSDPMHIDSEAARRLQAKSQKYFAELANPKAQLPSELNAMNELVAKLLDRTEGIRQIMESIKKFRKENGLPPIGEGFDVRTMVEAMDSKIANETKLFVMTKENELRKAIYKLAKRVEKSDFYKKYKYEKEPKQNGKKSKLTPREIIERYLIACDSIEREELKGNPRGAGDFLKRMGVDMVQYRQEFLDAFANTQEGIDEINHLWETIRGVTDMVISEGERSGLISQEEAISYKRRRFYVPERDFAEVEANEELQVKDAGYGSGRMGNKLMATQEAEGGETLAANVLANMTLLARDAIVKANKNIVKLAMFDLLRANEEWCKANHVPIPRQVWYKRNADGSVTRVTDGPTAPEKKTMRDLKTQIRDRENEIIQERMLAESATDAATRQAHMDVIAEIEEEIESLRQANPFLDEFDARDMMFLSRHTQKESTVTVFVDGVPCEMHFPNMTIVANALNGTTNKKFAAEGLKKLTNALSATMTVYNPAFFTVNVVRDIPFILAKGYAEYGWQFPMRFAGQLAKTFFTLDVWKAVAGNYKDVKSPYVREFFEGGGNTGYSTIPDIDKLKSATKRWDRRRTDIGMQDIGDVISYMNTFSEVWTRLAAYSVVRDMGGTKEDGVRAAKNLSVNFNRKGLGAPIWDTFMNMSFFANAALQGASGFYRTFKGNKDTIAKNVAVGFRAANAFLVTPMFAGFISTLLHPDDDDELLWINDWDRDNYWYIGESGFRIAINEQIKPAWVIGVNIALGMKGRRTKEQIASSIISSVFTNWLPAPQNINGALTMATNSYYGTKDYSTAQVVENLFVPQAMASFTDIANNVDFMGYKIKNESGDLPAYMSNENSALLYKIVAEFLYEANGGDKDLPSKHIEVVNEDGTIDYKKMSDLYDKSPKEINTIMSIAIGSTWKDFGNAIAVANTDGEFVPTDYQTIKRFYKPTDKEMTILSIMREARGITKDYTEQYNNYINQIAGSKLDGNTEKGIKARERLENIIGKGEDRGQKEMLKVLVNAYDANTMYSHAKQFGMNETQFEKSLGETRPDLLDAFKKYNSTSREELVRKILTLTRDIKDMEVKTIEAEEWINEITE